MNGPAAFRSSLMTPGFLLGTWSIVPSPMVVEMSVAAGLDFVILDLEHGAHDLSSLATSITAARARGGCALVRVPSPDHPSTQSALDLGATGLVFPRVRTVAEASRAVAATRLAPRGQRGYNPFTSDNDFGLGAGLPEDPVAVVIIECRDAVTVLDEILAIDGLDGIYLGVYDMSVELGHPGQVDHPDVRKFVTEATRAAVAAGRWVGAMATSHQGLRALRDAGVQLLVYGTDTSVYADAVRRAVGTLGR